MRYAFRMQVLETERLVLRWVDASDAPFILELLNEPSWLRFIGDKGVRTLADARDYIANGPVAMYAKHGFGLYLAARKEDGAKLGLCGLIKRDTLEDVDVGFAFLPAYWGSGYAREATRAVVDYANAHFERTRIVAITTPDNERSGHLLTSLGFRLERTYSMVPGEPELRLFGRDF